jgi:hypothetical protein
MDAVIIDVWTVERRDVFALADAFCVWRKVFASATCHCVGGTSRLGGMSLPWWDVFALGERLALAGCLCLGGMSLRWGNVLPSVL